jgi:hypothetical protein
MNGLSTVCTQGPRTIAPELNVDASVSDDPGDTKLFRSYSDEFVHMDATDNMKRRITSRHKPDNVWGLRKTRSVAQYRSEFARRHDSHELRHSPFKNSDLTYPFLIVESKREGEGPGFEYAEAQSAFPIRTCLRLQEELKQVSGQHLVPLVWFLAYQGDEWRAAACIVDDGKYVSAALQKLVISLLNSPSKYTTCGWDG